MIGLLAELRAALAEYESSSELREGLALLAVRTPDEPAWLWVFVSFGGRYFSWDNVQRQHPVRDMPGTARRIAAQVSERSVSGMEVTG